MNQEAVSSQYSLLLICRPTLLDYNAQTLETGPTVSQGIDACTSAGPSGTSRPVGYWQWGGCSVDRVVGGESGAAIVEGNILNCRLHKDCNCLELYYQV